MDRKHSMTTRRELDRGDTIPTSVQADHEKTISAAVEVSDDSYFQLQRKISELELELQTKQQCIEKLKSSELQPLGICTNCNKVEQLQNMDQEYNSSLSERLLSYCKEDYLCDTMLVTSGKAVNAHSVLLAAASPFLKAQLDNQVGPYCIVVPDVDYKTLCVAVYFIYTGNLMLPANRTEEYYAVMRSALLGLGLDSARINSCKVFYVRNNELQFNQFSSPKNRRDKDGSDTEEITPTPRRTRRSASKNPASIPRLGQLLSHPKNKKAKSKRKKPAKKRASKNSVEDKDISEIEPSENEENEDDIGEESKDILPSTVTSFSVEDVMCEIKEELAEDSIYSEEIGIDYISAVDIKDDNDDDDGSTISAKSTYEDGARGKRMKELEQDDDNSLFQAEDAGYVVANNKKLYMSLKSRKTSKIANDDIPINTEAVRSYKCGKCQRVFNSGWAVQRHRKMVHQGQGDVEGDCVVEGVEIPPAKPSGRMYTCRTCRRKFKTQGLLEIHMHFRHKTGKASHECSICRRNFTTEWHLKCHMVVHIKMPIKDSKSTVCHICGKQFALASRLYRHLKKPHGQFKCDKCDAAFRGKEELAQHSVVAHGTYIMMRKPKRTKEELDDTGEELCPVCGKLCQAGQPFLKHRFMHRRNCGICSERFEGDTALEQHFKAAHPGEVFVHPLKCTVCRKMLSSEDGFRKHMKIHSNEHPFTCKICDRPFKMIERLRAHIKKFHPNGELGPAGVETNQRGRPKFAYRQSVEELNFETVGQRIRFHDSAIKLDDSKYECRECGEVRNNYTTMRLHLDSHSDFRYMCKICNKCFTSETYIRNHSRIHTNELPYKCDECGKAFRQANHLMQHQHLHRGTKPYSCRICGKGYVGNPDLRNHYIKVHNIEITKSKINNKNTYLLNLPEAEPC